MKKKYLFLLILLGCFLAFFWFFLNNNKRTEIGKMTDVRPIILPTKSVVNIYPIAEFKERVTKKPYGIYITPKNSTIQPERFQGFHTGVDVEYEDAKAVVPVYAVCDGEIVLSKWISGYGGTAVLKCLINKTDYYIVYGHLKASSISKSLKVLKGDQIAVLGQGKTQETDFEREHLHFGIHQDSLDLRGYVQNQDELKRWIDPLSTNLFG